MSTILIAEDDLMIADMTEQALLEHGHNVCGIARTVDEAVGIARVHKPDLLLLDLRLANGGLGTDVAAQLSGEWSVGILYATGNTCQVNLSSADGHACLAKPYRPHDLLRGLEIVADLVLMGSTLLPFPKNLELLRPAMRHREVVA